MGIAFCNCNNSNKEISYVYIKTKSNITPDFSLLQFHLNIEEFDKQVDLFIEDIIVNGLCIENIEFNIIAIKCNNKLTKYENMDIIAGLNLISQIFNYDYVNCAHLFD